MHRVRPRILTTTALVGQLRAPLWPTVYASRNAQPGFTGSRLSLIVVICLALAACGDDGGNTPAPPTMVDARSSTVGNSTPQDEALKIGWLTELSGGLAMWGASIQTGVGLAIMHINAAGGVNGRDVVLVTAETGGSPIRAAEEARRLVDIEGVHAIVGPLSTGSTFDTELVTTSARVPLITPTVSSPVPAAATDGRYLFRTTVTDAAAITLAAQLLRRDGYSNVGVVFPDRRSGLELARTFEATFGGTVTLVPYLPWLRFEGRERAEDYVGEIRQAAASGAEAMLMMGFPDDVDDLIHESVANDIRSRFILLGISPGLADRVGADRLEGSLVVTIYRDPNYASGKAWKMAYMAEYGKLPEIQSVSAAYDAVVTIALAAEAAGSTDGPAIRDQLARIAGPPGRVFLADASGVQAALDAVRNGEDIDFQGSLTPIDWNAAGEVTVGFMTVFEYRRGLLEVVEARRFRVP